MPGSDMPDVLKNYSDLCEIGQGATGVVYKAKDLENDGRFVAIKKFKVNLTDEGGVPPGVMREVSTLKQITMYGHSNVIKLLDICHGPRVENERQLLLYMIYEHMEMDLAEYISRCPPPGIPVDRIRYIMKQLLSGVDFLHTHSLVHRDIKPQNLLMNANGDLKIADFGLAKLYEPNMALTSVVATLWYRAPEVLLSGTYTTALDLWSCGCVMGELYKKSPLFPGYSEGDQLRQIFSVLGTPPESDWPLETSILRSSFEVFDSKDFRQMMPELCDTACDLLKGLLAFVPSRRLNALQALGHSYLKHDFENN